MSASDELIGRGLRHERAGMLDEAMRCYEAAGETAGSAAEAARALRHQADVLRIRCQWNEALIRGQQAETLARDAADASATAEAINAQAAVHQSRGDFDSAAPLYERVLEIAPAQRIRGIALQNLGAIAAMRGNHALAAERFEASVACFEADGYERGTAIALNNLGRASIDQGAFERAEVVLDRAVAQARQIDDLELSSVALVNQAEALLHRGAFSEAEEGASEALGFFKISGNLWRQVECLRLLGDIFAGRREREIALRLYRQALAVAEQIDAHAEAAQVRSRIEALGPELQPEPEPEAEPDAPDSATPEGNPYIDR